MPESGTSMKALSILFVASASVSLSLPACEQMQAHENERGHEEQHQKIVVTSPEARDVVITQKYVCQIHSRRHIEIRALQEGFLQEIEVREGQSVSGPSDDGTKGEVLFKIMPALFEARLDAERAEARLAEIKLANTRKLFDQRIVSDQEVKLCEAELAKVQAKVKLAEAELNFTVVRAPFDGIIDRLYQQQGSLVKKEDLLTTLSDNDVMWVYFNVPEAAYLDYMARRKRAAEARGESAAVAKGAGSRDQPYEMPVKNDESERVELRLANGAIFPYTGRITAIEGQFNNETGNIPFRADFPNPDRLLRHGQTGTVVISQTLKGAMVIPQRATFEILDKRYVWVVGDDHVVRQRPITVAHELEDIFVVLGGLSMNEKIVLDGVRQVHDGEKVETEFRKPEKTLANQKFHAE
jgi:membrane fusion protein (multidrug efflux system)